MSSSTADEIVRSLVTSKAVVAALQGTNDEVTRTTLNNWIKWGLVVPWASLEEEGRSIYLFRSLEDGIQQVKRCKELKASYTIQGVRRIMEAEREAEREGRRRGRRPTTN